MQQSHLWWDQAGGRHAGWSWGVGCSGRSHRALTAGLRKPDSKRLMARQPGCLLRRERPVRSQDRTPICFILRHFRPVLHTLSKHHPGFTCPLTAALVGPSPQSTVQTNAQTAGVSDQARNNLQAKAFFSEDYRLPPLFRLSWINFFSHDIVKATRLFLGKFRSPNLIPSMLTCLKNVKF